MEKHLLSWPNIAKNIYLYLEENCNYVSSCRKVGQTEYC